MRSILAMPLLACLTNCGEPTTAQQASMNHALAVACNVDGIVVPLAQPIVASMGRNGVAAASMDSLLVHPAVVAACRAINGTPAIATPVAPTGTTTPLQIPPT